MVYLIYRIISTILSVYLGRWFRNMSIESKVRMAKAYLGY